MYSIRIISKNMDVSRFFLVIILNVNSFNLLFKEQIDWIISNVKLFFVVEKYILLGKKKVISFK